MKIDWKVLKTFFKSLFYTTAVTSLSFISYIIISDKISMAKRVKTNLENTLYMDLKDGRVVIRMLPNVAPKHVTRIKELVRSGFYDGLTFHRVIKNFIVQGGDPIGTGKGGSGQKIPAEFTTKYSHKRKAVSMARQTSDPNSADSQFFIVTADSAFLDGQYTIWGYVTEGMEFIDNIEQGNIFNNGIVDKPDKIIKMSVAIDVENAIKNSKEDDQEKNSRQNNSDKNHENDNKDIKNDTEKINNLTVIKN